MSLAKSSSIALFGRCDPRRVQSAHTKSYIHRLPNELVQEIFMKGFRDHGSDLGSTFPLVVSFVCSRWRVVALSTSALWSKIPIILPKHYGPSLVETYLVRSHLRLLEIEAFEIPGDTDAKVVEELASANVQALLPHIGRWQKLTLWPKHPSIVQTMLSLLTGEASNLLDLCVGNVDDNDSPPMDMYDSQSILPPSFRAPRLEHIQVFNYPHAWNKTSLGCVVSLGILTIQVENEHLVPPTFQELVPILLSQPKLHRLTVVGPYESDSDSPLDEDHPCCLPSLRTVVLEDTTENVLVDFFSSFMAPELREMAFENVCYSENPRELLSVLDRFHNRFPKLDHFSLAGCGELAATILSAHFITSVTVHICNLGEEESEWPEPTNDAIFTSMSRPFFADKTWLCPSMRSLEVLGIMEDTTTTLRPLVQARLEASLIDSPESPCAIESLYIFGLTISQADRQWLFENVEDFMVVEDCEMHSNREN